jgi:glutamate-1-semialdehyde 2,1-aminomutase
MQTSESIITAQKRSSKDIYSDAVNIIPGGVSRNTVFHKPHPQYAAKAQGCHVTDIEGTERIDFANNMASLIHGHAHPAILEAVISQLQRGTAYTIATEIEYDFAKLLTSRVPGFEKIRFVNSGTEAVMAMIKASRAFTGRPKIAKAEGAYHGTYDFAEISQFASPANWGDINHPNSVPLAFGTPQGVLDDVIIFPYNDIERTIAILDKHAKDIACVLIDPVPHRVGLIRGTEQFIEAIYNWTRKNDALLVFDEVVTFRVNYQGAQADYKVKPDLTALGKIIGGGFPVGAFTGRADVMNLLDPGQKKLLFPHSGTFSANPVTMTAGNIAMEMYDKEAVKRINALTSKAISQIKESIRLADVPLSITGAGSMFRIHLRSEPPTTYREAYQPKEEKAIINEMLDYLFYHENLILINTLACMFSTVITQHEVDILSEAMLKSFRAIKPKLDHLN